MTDLRKIDPVLRLMEEVPSHFREAAKRLCERLKLKRSLDVLVVFDGASIFVSENGGFGLGTMLAELQGEEIGDAVLRFSTADRDGPKAKTASTTPHEPKYTGFRFDDRYDGALVLDKYEEVWCFGFHPGNSGAPTDAPIGAHPTAATDAELRELTRWMNVRGGGVFATGDHDFLGASLCSRIPRVRSMRLWTNADGVPPISGTLRLDTNRPMNASQDPDATPAPAEIPNTAERDAVPQPIEWATWMSYRVGPFRRKRRPHPVLCHATHGPIDVMPDHPHEGRCFDTAPGGEAPLVSVDGAYDFGGGVAGDEYPASSAGVRPLPNVIAYGRTLADPPHDFEKGDQPSRRFPMISVYDGRRAGVGRVAVDSTWHHWFNMNLNGLRAAGQATGAPAAAVARWEKIRGYFVNLARWLAPPGALDPICLEILRGRFAYPGVVEWRKDLPLHELGRLVRERFVIAFGPCWVTEWTIERIDVLDRELADRLRAAWIELPDLRRKPPKPPFPPDPCLSCPPIELFESLLLGGVARAVMGELDKAFAERGADKVDRTSVDRAVLHGAAEGLAEAGEVLAASLAETKKLFAPLLKK